MGGLMKSQLRVPLVPSSPRRTKRRLGHPAFALFVGTASVAVGQTTFNKVNSYRMSIANPFGSSIGGLVGC